MEAFVTTAWPLWLGEIVPTLTRYVLFAAGVWLALWVVLAGLLQSRKIREASPPLRQLLTEFLVSLRSMVIFASFGVAITLAARAGFYPLADLGTTGASAGSSLRSSSGSWRTTPISIGCTG